LKSASIGLKRNMLKISEIGVSTELIGYIPYLEELSKLPHLNPLFSDKKVDIEAWRETIPKAAGKVRGKINLKKIYRIINLI